MSEKIHPMQISVVYASSEDENHPASELSRSSKRGWQSAKLSEYPQEIGFRFEGEIQLSQLQILAHQSKTPTRIEVFVATVDPQSGAVPQYHSAHFQRLGFLAFRSNEHSKYRSRERKTVQLDIRAYLLKLVIHKCHMNAMNLYNQVSIMQVAAYGDLLIPISQHRPPPTPSQLLPPVRTPSQKQQQSPQRRGFPSSEENIYAWGGADAHSQQPSKPHRNGNQNFLPPLPQHQRHYDALQTPVQYRQQRLPPVAPLNPYSLGYDENVSKAVVAPPAMIAGPSPVTSMNGLLSYRSTRILQFEDFYVHSSKELTAKKSIAVDQEDFDTAKSCKEQLEFLQSMAERIYDLEATKLRTIYEEDFEGSTRAKQEMDCLCEQTMNSLKRASKGERFIPENPHSHFPQLTKSQAQTVDAPPLQNSDNGGASGPSSIHMTSDASAVNFDEQPVQSKYALMMAEQAKQKQNQHKKPAEKSEGDENGDKLVNDDEGVDDDDDQPAEYTDPEDEHEEDDEESDDEDKEEKSTPKKPEKNAPQKTSKRPSAVTSPAPGKAEAEEEEEEVIDAAPAENADSEPISKPSAGFDLETFEEWERDVYFAIQDEASKEGVEAPAEPLETTEGISEFYSIFGAYTTACLFNRRWKLREAALRVISQFLDSFFKHVVPTNAINAMLKYFDTKGYGLLDPIQTVFFTSCDFLVKIIEGRIEDCPLSAVQIHVANLLPRLLLRATDSTPKTREEALTVIFVFAQSAIGPERVGMAVLADLVDQDKRKISTLNHRAYISRLSVMQQLLTTHGLDTKIAVDMVMTRLLVPSLNHSNHEVRDLAVVVTGCIDVSKGQEIMKYLHLVRNPATRSVIEEKLAFLPEGESPPAQHHEQAAPAAAPARKSKDEKKKRPKSEKHND